MERTWGGHTGWLRTGQRTVLLCAPPFASCHAQTEAAPCHAQATRIGKVVTRVGPVNSRAGPVREREFARTPAAPRLRPADASAGATEKQREKLTTRRVS